MQSSERSSSSPFRKVGQNLYRHETSGTYYALFKRSGKQIRRSLKTKDRSLANRRLREQRRRIEKLSTKADARTLTFDDIAKRFYETQQVRLKPKSLSRIDTCIKGLKPSFKGVTVRNITQRHCENWMTTRGRQISAQSYKHERRVLIAILDFAVTLGLLLDNPAKDFVVARKVPKPIVVPPTKEQFCRMIEEIRKADVRAQDGGDLIELLAYSGMRLAEAQALRWGDIDFERGTFIVTGGEQGTKNHESRCVPLFPALRALLERIGGEKHPEAAELVVKLHGSNGARRCMATACTKLAFPIFSNHDMRHFFCSNAIEKGIDFKVIAAWLGHKDGGLQVAKTYGHLRDTHSHDMAKLMTLTAPVRPRTSSSPERAESSRGEPGVSARVLPDSAADIGGQPNGLAIANPVDV